jgi:3-dehydroquinate synthetase
MPGGERVAALIHDRAAAIVARDPEVLTELVAACAAMKAHVVASDPHERTGIRATLNLGHTLGHALESVGGYELLHGEAVAVGLVYAGALAGALERIDGDDVAHYRNVVSALDLPTAVPGTADPEALLASMRRDKKSLGGLTFVLPGPMGLETVHDPDPRALAVAFRAVGVGDS